MSLDFNPNPVVREYPSAIVHTNGIVFATGFGPEDLFRALGPVDHDYVGIVRGTLVFSFASVPEPSTALLLALGVVGIAVGRRRTGGAPARPQVGGID